MKKVFKLMVGCAITTSVLLANNDDIKNEAVSAIKKLGGTLKSHLQEKMKEGGVEGAASFCSYEAQNLSQEVSQSLPKGTSVKRITLKPRNELNVATGFDKEVLEQIQKDIDSGKKAQMVVKEIEKNHYKVYKPIIIDKVCLKCHGNESQRDKEAYKIIKEKYPSDTAIDYKEGELRGAFLVEIIK